MSERNKRENRLFPPLLVQLLCPRRKQHPLLIRSNVGKRANRMPDTMVKTTRYEGLLKLANYKAYWHFCVFSKNFAFLLTFFNVGDGSQISTRVDCF